MIDLLITGGTLDKDYHAQSGEFTFEQTHLPEMLKQANCTLEIQPQVLMLKDSLEMTDGDRQIMGSACRQAGDKILITHGTDTMVETGRFLFNQAGLADKTIVLTGAMRPFKLGRSDALFNLGSALMACQLLAKGIYIIMNGQVFDVNQVTKNREVGIFEIKEAH